MQRLTPKNNAQTRKRKPRGMIQKTRCKQGKIRLAAMTLIELLLTVALVSILAAIAYPSYQSHLLKSYRSQALADMVKLQLELETTYHRGYNWSNLVSAGGCSLCETPPTRYVFSIASDAGKAYVIKATAQSSSGQTQDQCLIVHNTDSMTLDANNTSFPPTCWH